MPPDMGDRAASGARLASRRGVLGLVAGAAVGSVTGCLGGTRETVTLDLGDPRRAADGQIVKPRDVAVQSTLFYDGPGYRRVLGAGGIQYVIVSGAVGDHDLTLRLDSDAYESVESLESDHDGAIPVGRMIHDGVQIGQDVDAGYCLVPVPTDLAPASGALVLRQADGPTLRWSLPDAFLARLSRPPSFEVRQFDAPKTVPRGDPVPVSVRVARTRGRDEPFRAAITSPDAGGTDLALSPDEGAASWAGRLGYEAGTETVDYTLDWARGTRTRTVEIADE